jgi:hypothetical protein
VVINILALILIFRRRAATLGVRIRGVETARRISVHPVETA